MSTRSGTLVAALLAIAVVLTSCGDDENGDSPADPQHDRAVAALAKRVEADNTIDADSQLVSGKEAECVAASLVDEVGVDKLVELKILTKDLGSATLPDDMPKAMREPQVNALSACVGLVDFVARSTRGLMRAVAATPEAKSQAADDKYWKAVTSCLEGEISEEAMRQAMLDSIEEPEAAKRQLAPAMSTCEQKVD